MSTIPTPLFPNESLDDVEKTHFKNLIEANKELQTKLNSFVEFLALKYKLNPSDQLTPEGTILRAKQEEEKTSDLQESN